MRNQQQTTNKCDGGHYSCSPPKECCKQGCCFLLAPSYSRPPSIQTGNIWANPLFLGHWYFWLAVTATVVGILCACSLWRKHNQGGLCCRTGSGEDRTCSEPDSIGSCYAPPQYSRCNSFHQPPPPYSEVTSKPDMYPLVISYNNTEPIIKNNNTSTRYLMVQYFRNFIGRPVGSLSATSTNDSISSSFLCNAVNEVNTIVPPTYSNVASLEELVSDQSQPSPCNLERLPRSSSSISETTNYNREFQQTFNLPSNTVIRPPQAPTPVHQPLAQADSQRNTSLYSDNHTSNENRNGNTEEGLKEICQRNVALAKADDRGTCRPRKPLLQPSQDSTEDEEPFSALLNLSLCATNIPEHVHPHVAPLMQDLQFGVTNSMTGSDISSLANLGTPDSPPRATSPTVEMRELLDKIQQLPAQKSPQPPAPSATAQARAYFHRVRAKTLYMPLGEAHVSSSKQHNKTMPNVFSRSWLSRSAPCTPCGPLAPTFPVSRGSQKGSKSKVTDGSPLLKQHAEESEEEPHRNEPL
ncbi:uncharacterized protein LOC115878278 isoform X3 [Sitophilus oryzae]|uniref:WW domain binding protein VOPP1 n=1 Tax=Sitophilus oryzae TaxID=7048 RepID=A0A6J2XIS0_SITOR|nr:uncharacterized protein LOC115878278 isoform X3 [Sitophilus oryzae]